MDKQLAEMYGTFNDESDTEKVAAAQLAAALTPEEDDGEVKVAELSDEQVEQLAEAVLAHIMGSEKEPAKNEAKVEAKEEEAAVEEPAEEEEKVEAKAEEKEEAEAKDEEPAEKQAAAEEEEAREKLAEADFLGRVMAHAFTNELKLIKQAQVEEQPVEKKASAFDTLAEQRAAEILHANGINPETLKPYEQQEEVTEEPEKQAASEEELAALDSKVTERAMSLLSELGFEFETEQQ